jgi:RNA polymerase sigma-70 factor (ECF subfamily)
VEAALQSFREALAPRVLDDPEGTQALRDVIERARESAAAEGYALDLSSFARELARHAASADDPTTYLKTVRAEDIALATACAGANAQALAVFERTYFGEIERAFKRIRRDSVDPGDFAQQVRERLFVSTPERRARIGDYSGTGELRTWFRVAVTRALTSESMRPKRDTPTEADVLAELPGRGVTPELELLQRKYSAEFRASFGRTLLALEERDRAILRYTIVDRLGIDALSQIYQVHRATAARWVQKARDELVQGVRDDLAAKLRVPEDELQSILRIVADEVEVSVRGLLPSELHVSRK